MRCLICGAPLGREGRLDEILFREDLICGRCRRQWQPIHRRFRLNGIQGMASWQYNEAFAHCLIQFKECGDEALKDIFLYPVRSELRRFGHGSTLLLMPSSRIREEERGFCHLAEMFSCLELPMISCFEKTEDTDQRQKSGRQRRSMATNIRLREGAVLPEKIILVDDVLTTGSTLRGALSCLDRQRHRIRIYVCAWAYDHRSAL